MFGLSFGKFVVFALIVGAVWFGYKYANRIDHVRRAMRGGRPPPAPQPPPRVLQAEDLEKCRICGAYVTANSGRCGRPDCTRVR